MNEKMFMDNSFYSEKITLHKFYFINDLKFTKCMIKSGPFAAFNNVFSNIGYILLGIMFIIVVKKV